GLISIVAPLGKALLGKKVGDSFEVETPAGISAYEVVKIG
ncbi:MAG: GreA/GreB family elongation factor, partial [Rickettsiales bacterium]|nr:GreA/GreB family elongation factor [Rickettsiales bacterium]